MLELMNLWVDLNKMVGKTEELSKPNTNEIVYQAKTLKESRCKQCFVSDVS